MNPSAKDERLLSRPIVGRTAVLAAIVLACGCVIGASGAHLAALAGASSAGVDGPSTEIAGGAIADRLRDRLRLTDSQREAVQRVLDARLDSVAAIRADVARRMAAEHGTLDRELRKALSDEQYAEWRQIVDELRAARRRRGGWGFGRGT